ncbi:glycosyltransferase family 4 protein [Achromobacter sp.]|uniref:MraY family glycosyltransferase n=1 Tax=Achromobacter sp. TaxID=134375 RepID=UPI000EBD044A|nr:glycosyltransferase family 4 protein [Achromobacter sp.]HCW17651.1 glycosyl transferase [Achromobacter sp.]
MIAPWWLFGLVFALAWLLTGALRRYALARNVIDVPNARSSHKTPTPRGGGISFVVAFVAGMLAMGAGGFVAWSVVCGVAVAGAWIALIGFLDDHGHIQARWRLLAHFIGAGWGLYWMGGVPALSIGGLPLEAGWLLNIAAAFYLVWLLNLYNFMDGIDGLASVEAICVTVGASVLYFLTGAGDAGLAPMLLAAAVLGFLIWNFPPAKIFMGDGGSGFLGLTLGILSLKAGWQAPELFWAWTILLGVFIVDATLTLLRRLIRGEKVYEAHRTHAYQYASRKWGSHVSVTLTVLAINVLWLFPMACLVALGKMDGSLGMAVAYAPLVIAALRLKAGVREPASA